ncbi:MAG: FlxA-like family protein [Gammaproteobacteria bacterium]|nr:MAG: FlxA-like family protein [Gammaproteobacteria bacterium]
MNIFRTSALVAALLSTPLMTQAATSSNQLQQEIDALKKQNKIIMERLDATAEMMEATDKMDAHGDKKSSNKRSTHHGSSGKTTVGGYGEMHYSNLDGEGGAADKQEMDFHRAVLFVGHEFDDKTRFFMEWDLEHSFEMELEQAFLEFDLNENTQLATGVMLMPFGILNETHEPTTFYGVDRSPVASNIIPSTWREGGVAVAGKLSDSVSYDVFVTTGLQLDPTQNYKVRKGRKGVSEAPAKNLAYSGRITWNGVPGLQISASYLTQSDAGQGIVANVAGSELLSTALSWQVSKFQLRAVYAAWNIDGSAPAAIGADKQNGWYVEPSYKITPKFGLFARQNQWDNQAGNGSSNSAKKQTDVGFNYWPHEDVVFKFHYQTQSNANSENQNGFNMGIGYQF